VGLLNPHINESFLPFQKVIRMHFYKFLYQKSTNYFMEYVALKFSNSKASTRIKALCCENQIVSFALQAERFRALLEILKLRNRSIKDSIAA
jgi:hypothetical protein